MAMDITNKAIGGLMAPFRQRLWLSHLLLLLLLLRAVRLLLLAAEMVLLWAGGLVTFWQWHGRLEVELRRSCFWTHPKFATN